jgi:hypothetical protein
MKPDLVLRVFADHYQFFVYDGDSNPFDPLPSYSEETVARGWTRTERALSFATVGVLNDHRLDVFFRKPPTLVGYDRATIHGLNLRLGALGLHDTEDQELARLSPGDYAIVMVVYNLGAEQSAEEEELSDEAFLQRDDWERYAMYVYPVEQTVEDGIFR